MNEKNVFVLFPILYTEEKCINVTGSDGRGRSVDYFNTGLVVLVDYYRSLWWILEISKNRPKEQNYVSSRYSGKKMDSVELSAVTFCVLDLNTAAPQARQIENLL